MRIPMNGLRISGYVSKVKIRDSCFTIDRSFKKEVVFMTIR